MLAGHVTVVTGGIPVAKGCWTVSIEIARRLWWRSISFSLCRGSPLLHCGSRRLLVARRFSALPERDSHQVIYTRGDSSLSARSNLQVGRPGSLVREYVPSDGMVRARAVPREVSSFAMDTLTVAQQQLQRHAISLSDYVSGEHRAFCPKCHGGSTREKSLAVKINDDGGSVWNCHRAKCGWTGSTKKAHGNHRKPSPSAQPRKPSRDTRPYIRKQPLSVEGLKIKPISVEVLEWFQARKISKETLDDQGVMQTTDGKGEIVIAFPYKRDDQIVNCKFRTVEKHFWQVPGAEKVLYGLNDIKDFKDIIIVEGEIDKLTFQEAGYKNCVSVPDGAPPKASSNGCLPSRSEGLRAPKYFSRWTFYGSFLCFQDKKYEYLYNCRNYFDEATRIYLATDADEPGQALAEELARRLGRERCWRVTWPTLETGEVCKDANEVMQHLGKDALQAVIDKSELYPIRGLFQFSEFFKEVDDYYYLRLGDERGVSTGWKGLDDIYRVVPGELSVVTGVPNSGKSEWIDALLCNLNRQKGWSFALCSMENKVPVHARKLVEKYTKLPFFDAPYANSVKRMTKEQLDKGKTWLNSNFFLIRCEDDELPSVDWVLSLAKAAVLRYGIRGLVIDPYNELDHQRPSSQTETEYVSQMLTRIKRFAQHHDCHVWFVAHPKQLQVWRGEAPGLYDISGSAHFINKCDNGIIIHRNRDPDAGPLDQVKVLVRKVRNKAAGTIGEASLQYDRVTGEYSDCG